MKFPRVDQVRELQVQLEMVIPEEWEDRNGHVNVQFYLALYELGGWVVLEDVGVDETWFEQRGCSLFDLEHHLKYCAEILVGDKVTTHNRILSRSDKCFHGLYLIVNETRDCLAATLEYVTAGVDMKTRRIAPFPEELAVGLDRVVDSHRQLSWPAPVCGAMKP